MSLALILTLAAGDLTPPPERAEVCYAHVMLLVIESAEASGRVAGPTWFIRDWWDERLTDDQLGPDRQAAVLESVRARLAAEPEATKAEGDGCFEEAIKAGAVPGWDD